MPGQINVEDQVELLLTEHEAAVELKLKPKTLTRWRWAGTGPRYYKVGGAIRYRRSDLEAFISGGADQ